MRLVLCMLLFISLEIFANDTQSNSNRTFRVDYQNNQFLKDDQPFQFVSGGFHYFRAHPQKWRALFQTIRAAGLNAVETYVQWTSHNPHDGQYKWTGLSDIEEYLRIAHEEGLLVILRPSPFICGEQSGGGYPYWLLAKYPNMKFRTTDPDYLKEVSKWFSVLMPRLQPHLYGNGGPIIMVQVENEYGVFGCNNEYMTWMRNETQKYVQDKAVLFTNSLVTPDHVWWTNSVRCGKVDNVYQALDFSAGSAIDSFWQLLKNYQPTGPHLNAEYYTGWVTSWQDPAVQTTDPGPIADSLRTMLKSGANVNMYMFFGGTNFGWSSGAQRSGANDFSAYITSYDYDAPMDEAGDVTPKYTAIRDVIKDFFPMPNISVPAAAPKMKLPSIQLSPKTTLFSRWSRFILGGQRVESKDPLTFGEVNQDAGFVLYETIIPDSMSSPGSLQISKLYDRATIYVNNTMMGILTRENSTNSIQINTDHGRRLQILVESQGRLSFAVFNEPKGIAGDVTLNNEKLENWNITGFPFEHESYPKILMNSLRYVEQDPDLLKKIENRSSENLSNDPIIFDGKFDINDGAISDTYIDPTGWGKGFIVVNGFNLGRYWPSVGPQITIYLPKEILLEKDNSIIVVELENAPTNGEINFSDTISYFGGNNNIIHSM